MELADFRLRQSLWLPEELLEAAVEHALRAVMVRKVAHIEREAAIGLRANQFPAFFHLREMSVGRKAHHFPFGVVDFESKVGRDRAVEQSERMRETNLAGQLDVRATATAQCRRRPF